MSLPKELKPTSQSAVKLWSDEAANPREFPDNWPSQRVMLYDTQVTARVTEEQEVAPAKLDEEENVIVPAVMETVITAEATFDPITVLPAENPAVDGWVLMTNAEYVAHLATHQAAWDTWKAANPDPE